MKTILAVLAIVGVLIFVKIYSMPAPAPAPAKVVYVPVATPIPKPVSTPPPRRLAPEGTFFVTQYASVKTPNGIVGFEPGRMVKFVSADEAKGTLRVTDGKYEVDLGPMQLTNDLDVAAMAQRADEASQQQLMARLEQDRQTDTKLRRETDLAYSKDVSRIRTSSGVGGVNSKLDAESKPASAADRAAIQYGSPYYYLHRSMYYPYY